MNYQQNGNKYPQLFFKIDKTHVISLPRHVDDLASLG